MSKTAVVILNYNGENYLRQFLPSVLQYSGEAEIIVADNASTDSSLRVLKEEFPRVRIIALDKNYGFCGGYNRALQQVSADYYVLLNSDVEVTKNWLVPMETLLDTQATIAAVQPKIKSFHQKHLFEYAGAAGGLMDTLGYPYCRGRLFDYLEEDKGQYDDVKEIFWATGACMIIRSADYHAMNGLDETFFAHMEEIDLCWRLKRSGRSIFYTGHSTVYHVGGGTLSKSNPHKTFLNFRNGLYLVAKNFHTTELLTKLPLRMALDYIASVRFLVQGQFALSFAIIRAHLHFLMALPSWRTKRTVYSKNLENTQGRYTGSIIWDYFIRKKKIASF